MEDLYLEEQGARIEEFTKMLASLHIKDSSHHRQLQDELNQLSVLPSHITNKNNLHKQSNYRVFTHQCFLAQSLLNKSLFKIHNQSYRNNFNSDFNYLYNDDENLNGTEIYIYDLKTNERASTYELKSYHPNNRFLDKISGIIKISNSHLLITGTYQYECKGFFMDLKTKEISKMFDFNNQIRGYDKFHQLIYYDNYIYIFGQLGQTGLIKYDINRNTWKCAAFPKLNQRTFSVLFRNYVLISQFENSDFFLYDLIIENHSEISFYESIKNRKFLFTDQARVYLWMQGFCFYESDINNPFKWNAIGNPGIGINGLPYDITFSCFEGNLYSSYIIRPNIFFYKFNRERRRMELICQGEVNR